ncbi:MAG TPA: serine hydrolase domain-containing protein, partial [bacterium]|nr:serine hydrolase domain-containing protein [bacterium]
SAKGYGVRDYTSNAKVSKHTVFQLASLSKTFTSVLLGVLIDNKRLSLDDPIVKFLPDLVLGSPEHTKKIKVRHLLNQTTGFPSHSGDVRIEGGESFDQIIKSFSNLKILNGPGQVHSYQNVLYALAGKIIEEVTQMSFAQAVRYYLFTPLQMNDASVGRQAFKLAINRALPFRYIGGTHKQIPVSYDYYTVAGAAGVNASIADMAQWLNFTAGTIPLVPLANMPVISLATLQSLQKPSVSSPAETSRMRPYRERVTRTHYGLGFRISDWAGHRIVYHGGMVDGMKSILAFDPQKKAGIVILVNSNTPALGIIRSYFFDKLYGLNDIDWNQRFKQQELQAAQKKKARKKVVRK